MSTEKTFIEWIKSYKPKKTYNNSAIEDLVTLNQKKEEFKSQIHLLKKYMGWVRKTYNHNTIYNELELKSFDSDTKWGIHKIFFHAPDKSECWDYIENLFEEKANNIIDKI